MSLKLYMTELSPPVRSVLMTAKAINLELEQIVVNLGEREQLEPKYLKINPQHTVPTLVIDDDFSICDSHAILPFLVDKYAREDSLYPKCLKTRATINHRLHFDTATTALRSAAVKPVLMGLVKKIPQEKIDPILETYDILEKFLEQYKWVAADHVTIADLSLLPSFGISNELFPVDAKKYPKVADWLKRGEELPCFEVNKKGHQMLKGFIMSKLEQ